MKKCVHSWRRVESGRSIDIRIEDQDGSAEFYYHFFCIKCLEFKIANCGSWNKRKKEFVKDKMSGLPIVKVKEGKK